MLMEWNVVCTCNVDAVRAGLLALALAACGGAAAEVRDPNGVAVIIGNRDYGNERVPEVAFAHRDAEAFKRYVLDVLGYDPDNVIDLRDASQAEMMGTFGGPGTHESSTLWSYLDPVGGSDVVVFYSGHGVPGQRDRRGYLLPSDANPDTVEINGYPIDLLYENLGKLEEARGIRVYLDACFSGDSHRGMLIRDARRTYKRRQQAGLAGDRRAGRGACSIGAWSRTTVPAKAPALFDAIASCPTPAGGRAAWGYCVNLRVHGAGMLVIPRAQPRQGPWRTRT